ncbi:MAG: nucleotide exchange factor GrpE [Caldilineaceae bacterium]|nr:nucleotide exchange factor GrpE [Caldilineaceae bacterium]
MISTMAKKNKNQDMNEKEIIEAGSEAVAAPPVEGMPEGTDQASAEVEALKRQLVDAETKLAESVDGWQRSQAEFQNYKKRVERDSEMMRAHMKGEIVKKILPILDDLERAMQNRPADEPWTNGIELIMRKFQAALEGGSGAHIAPLSEAARIQGRGVPDIQNTTTACSPTVSLIMPTWAKVS